MSNYTKTTNFTAKDSLTSGDPAKLIKGSEYDIEFDNIQNAVNSKADSNNGTLTGTTTADIINAQDVNTNNLSINGTDVTATANEINTLDGFTGSVSDLNKLANVTASANELNVLDGSTATTGDLNKLAGISATDTEINTLDGLTASTSELNKLDGATVTTTELNKLDGFTGTVDDLNFAKGLRENGIDSATVNGLTVETAVPAGAVFTDTETTTSLDIVANELQYTDEEGNVTTIDLSLYLDDTNLARIVSGTYDSDNQEIVFTRDDSSEFRIDASMFFDDTNLVTSVSGKTGAVTLTASDISDVSASATELNYVDGVTSPIQDQLDDKAPIANPSFTGTVSADGLTVDAFTSTGIDDNATSKILSLAPNNLYVVDKENEEALSITSSGIAGVRSHQVNIGQITSGEDTVSSLQVYGKILVRDGGGKSFTIDKDSNSNAVIDYNSGFLGSSDLYIESNGSSVASFSASGNVEFYEDTGTTAKMVWDASAESLGIGDAVANDSKLVIRGGDYDPTTDGGMNSKGISIRGGTAGLGNRTGAVTFSTNAGGANAGSAAISGVLEHATSDDVMGLAFFTHGSTNSSAPAVERMRIDSSGKILAAAGTNWVGTVSQNGQSSVIERGSNANGEYVRFADGTQIAKVNSENADVAAGATVSFEEQSWPASFAGGGQMDERNVFCTVRSNSPENASELIIGLGSATGRVTDESVVSVAVKNTSTVTKSARPNIFGFGPWY